MDLQSIGVGSNGGSEGDVFVRAASEAPESRDRSNGGEKRKGSFGDVESTDSFPSRERQVELLGRSESSEIPRVSLESRINEIVREKVNERDVHQSRNLRRIVRRKQLD